MRPTGDFQYVDLATRGMPGFRNNVVRVSELGGLLQRYAQGHISVAECQLPELNGGIFFSVCQYRVRTEGRGRTVDQ